MKSRDSKLIPFFVLFVWVICNTIAILTLADWVDDHRNRIDRNIIGIHQTISTLSEIDGLLININQEHNRSLEIIAEYLHIDKKVAQLPQPEWWKQSHLETVPEQWFTNADMEEGE